MITKQVLEGKLIKEIKIDLLDLEMLIDELLQYATHIKQIFQTSMNELGMSFHSSNEIEVDEYEISNFNGCIVLSVNNNKFSIAINKDCNIVIQRPDHPSMNYKILFKDFGMTLRFI